MFFSATILSDLLIFPFLVIITKRKEIGIAEQLFFNLSHCLQLFIKGHTSQFKSDYM